MGLTLDDRLARKLDRQRLIKFHKDQWEAFKEKAKIERKKKADVYRAKHPWQLRWAKATLAAHRHKGYLVRVTVEHLVGMLVDACCPYCGDHIHKDNKSLDRVFSDEYLFKDTVEIVCNRCNTMKWTMTKDQFIAHCRKIVNNQRK